MDLIEQNIKQQNEIINRWRPKVRSSLKRSASQLSSGKGKSKVLRGTRREDKLAQSITSKTKQADGVINYVSFNFERHGIFVYKGVGRGYEMSSGKVIRTAKGPQTANRVPEDWFNPTIDQYLPELANKLAELDANIALNTAKSKIR